MQLLQAMMQIKMVPLQYLGNFWRALNVPLITCEVLKWSKNCVITGL